jgi:hypothetical protein
VNLNLEFGPRFGPRGEPDSRSSSAFAEKLPRTGLNRTFASLVPTRYQATEGERMTKLTDTIHMACPTTGMSTGCLSRSSGGTCRQTPGVARKCQESELRGEHRLPNWNHQREQISIIVNQIIIQRMCNQGKVNRIAAPGASRVQGDNSGWTIHKLAVEGLTTESTPGSSTVRK